MSADFLGVVGFVFWGFMLMVLLIMLWHFVPILLIVFGIGVVILFIWSMLEC